MRFVPFLVAGGALALVAAFAVLVRDDPDPSESEFEPAFVAVCEAADEAEAGNARSAQRIFFDRAHLPLHGLAVSAARPEGTRLLEVKNAVERLDGSGDRLASALDRLADATGAAIRSTGAQDPRPCPA